MRNIFRQEKPKNRTPEENLKQNSTGENENTLRNPCRYHCFRCGTPSLAKIQYKGLEIDVCANESCGCIHLDPGELDKILLSERLLALRVRRGPLFNFS
jgi:hypothetical protein